MQPRLPYPVTYARPAYDPAQRVANRREAWKKAGRRRRESPESERLEFYASANLVEAARDVARSRGISMSDLLREALAFGITCGGRSTAVREHLLAASVTIGGASQCPILIRDGAGPALDAEIGALLWRLGLGRASMREHVEAVAVAVEASQHVVEVYAATDASWRRCVREALGAAGLAGE